MLFVELTLIRWIGSNVVYLSYFSNFVLLGSFLGIGIGFLRANARVDLFAWSPALLALLVAFVLNFPVTVECAGGEIIFFGCTRSGLPIWVTLPVVFAAVALVMASISQGVARAFVRFEPLEAYRFDILGSLAGIAAFSLLSFLEVSPVAWGVVVLAAFGALYYPTFRPIQVIALCGLVVMLGKESIVPGFSWSPYYKISVFSERPGVYLLGVNGVPHQYIESLADRRRSDPVYFRPYRRLFSNPLRNVLVVGAGNGGDVAIALAAGAKHVDAVEIDPRIYQLGRTMNPEHPYADPRVSVHIADGRAFLEGTRNRYDLILFALPDSLALVSGQSSLRLESYLFTVEAMRAARSHLTSGGAFGMYNYYRQNWLLDRLAHTLEIAYGHRPCVDHTLRGGGGLSLLLVGRDSASVRCTTVWDPAGRDVPAPANDDRPFLYLRTPSIPQLYLIAVSAILLASFILIRCAAGPLAAMRSYLDLFFMGAAFMLLETKSVVQFALLFGTTWFVNALVFFGILVAVYVAVEVSRRVIIAEPWRLYVALFGALAVAWLVPPDHLLALAAPLRFAVAATLAFAPIFIANLIFAGRFRFAAASTTAFAANLLGAMVGGILEYSSLILGYRNELILVAILYGCAYFFSSRSQTSGQSPDSASAAAASAAPMPAPTSIGL